MVEWFEGGSKVGLPASRGLSRHLHQPLMGAIAWHNVGEGWWRPETPGCLRNCVQPWYAQCFLAVPPLQAYALIRGQINTALLQLF